MGKWQPTKLVTRSVCYKVLQVGIRETDLEDIRGGVSPGSSAHLYECNMHYFPPDNREYCAPVINRKPKAVGQVESRLPQWWFDHASEGLSRLQAEDSDVSQIISWKEQDKYPPLNDARLQYGTELHTLLAQWDNLVLRDKVLYRVPQKFFSEFRGSATYSGILQFVVPKACRIEIMHLLHDLSTAGHLGVSKTILLAALCD